MLPGFVSMPALRVVPAESATLASNVNYAEKSIIDLY
jgi:hypothetical protein